MRSELSWIIRSSYGALVFNFMLLTVSPSQFFTPLLG